MADSKITGLTALATAPSAGDLLLLVDVSDTTMAASGTNKKIDAKWLLFTNGTANTLADNIAGNSKGISNLGSVHVAGILRCTPTITNIAGAIVQGIVDAENSYSRAFFGYNARWDFTTNLWNLDNAGANDAVGWLLRNSSAAIDFVFHPSSGASARTMDHATFSAGAKFTMTNTGRLGILNTSPTYALDVAGTARVTTGVISPTYYGSIASGGSAVIQSTTHATKGKIYLGDNAAFDEVNTRLGIGTPTPSHALHIHGASPTVFINSSTDLPVLRFGIGGTAQFEHYYYQAFGYYTIAETGVGEHLRIKDGGNIELCSTSGSVAIGLTGPSYRLDVNGACHASSFPTSSDRRLKENIRTITSSLGTVSVLDKLNNINGYLFTWKPEYRAEDQFYEVDDQPTDDDFEVPPVPIEDAVKDDRPRQRKQWQIGLVAQEVRKEFPELVTTWAHSGNDGRSLNKALAVDYGRFVPILIEAIKQLDAELTRTKRQLTKRIEALETSITS